MAANDNWQKDFAGLMDAAQQYAWPEDVLQAQRVRFFQNRVQMSPQYQHAPSLKDKQAIEVQILGRTVESPNGPNFGNVQSGGSTDTGAESGPPFPYPASQASSDPGMLGRFAEAVTGKSLNTLGQDFTGPGGMLSPQSIGTGIGDALGTPGGPGMQSVLAGLGGAAGRGVEMAMDPSQRPDNVVGGLSDIGQAFMRGGAASVGGQLAFGGMQAARDRALQPLGELAPEQAATAAAAKAEGVPLLASQVRQSQRLSDLEAVPRHALLGGGSSQAATEALKAGNEKALISLAEAKSPGAKQDWSMLGQALQSGIKGRELKVKAVVDRSYERVKDMVGDGQFAAPTLEQAAGDIVGSESKMSNLASPAARTARGFQPEQPTLGGQPIPPGSPLEQALKDAGFETGKVYTFPELLSIKQKLGYAIQSTGNPSTRRQLLLLQNAVRQDLSGAAEAAGATEAIPLLKRVNEFESTHFYPTFRDPKLLSAAADYPSSTAAAYLTSNTPVEALQALKRAAGPTRFNQISRAFYESAEQDTTHNGQFNAPAFAEKMAQFNPEQLRTIVGQQQPRFNRLMDIFRQQGTMKPSDYGRRVTFTQLAAIVGAGYSTASGHPVAGLLGVGGALGTPLLLSKVLSTPGGIDWLTVGLTAKPGTTQFLRATSKLIGIAATRPAVTGVAGRFGRAVMGMPQQDEQQQ